MKSLKKIAVAVFITGFFAASLFAQEQSSQKVSKKNESSEKETSVESEYLSNIEDVIITELSSSEERDNKLVALQYLENAIDDGRVSPDMIRALNQLAGEGITSESRVNGRLANSFPDIRAKACDVLAKIPTEESKQILIKIALADNEPMVIAAAVRALGEIGINNDDEVTETIAWVEKKNAVLNPTSSLALEILIAFEKLMDTVQDKAPMVQAISQIAANYNYITPVRTKALELLKQLQNQNSSES